MSEKRFLLDKVEKGNAILSVKITDSVSDDDYFIMTKDFYEDDIDGVVGVLNEQQATIRRLQDLCGESDGENAKLRIENKMLEKEVNLLRPTNLEQYEQIQKLQEENEQLRENLHNCRLNKNIISEKLKLWQDVHKEYNIYSIKDFEELMKNDK